MQGIEQVAILSLLSFLFSLFSAPSLLLSSAIDQRNRISAFLQGIMRHRGRPPCRNAVIRDDSGANTPCCQSRWGPLAAFFCDFFFLLYSRISLSCYTRESANPVAVQLQCNCSLFIAGFFVFSLSSCLVFFRGRLLSLPSCLSVIEPSLFSLLSSLFPLLSLLLFSQIPLRD